MPLFQIKFQDLRPSTEVSTVEMRVEASALWPRRKCACAGRTSVVADDVVGDEGDAVGTGEIDGVVSVTVQDSITFVRLLH